MGKKSRARRSIEKAMVIELSQRGLWRENEFGELQRRMTKAEARRHVLSRAITFLMAERDIMRKACDHAKKEIHAIEDARVFAMLGAAASV